jgi:hypothetical protein
LRHNKPANPDDFRGVWRMRAPMPGDVLPGDASGGDDTPI